MFPFKKRKTLIKTVDMQIPAHIAIIMDGNRRWADRKKLPKVAGYKVGVEALREIYERCLELNVKYLTIFAFSTENKNRPSDEVNYLKRLFIEALNKEVEGLKAKNVRLRILGRIDEVEDDLKEKIESAHRATQSCNGMGLQVMFNYGGRAEIVDAVKAIVEKSRNDKSLVIDEALIENNLYMAGIPDPDLLIRTGSEFRVSNFLLWEIAYSEIVVSKQLFPDFRTDALLEAIKEYSSRTRKFGK